MPRSFIEKVGSCTVAKSDPVKYFGLLVEVVAATPPDGLLPSHITLQSSHCGLRSGATFDYYLPFERWHLWYDAFVSVLGLESVVASGWNVTTGPWNAPRDGSNCFYHAPGRACDGSALPQQAVSMGHSNHATGSDAFLDQYYTPRLAGMVSLWAHADLATFGYRPWAGVDAHAYLAQPLV
jgi:hypothetical protein